MCVQAPHAVVTRCERKTDGDPSNLGILSKLRGWGPKLVLLHLRYQQPVGEAARRLPASNELRNDGSRSWLRRWDKGTWATQKPKAANLTIPRSHQWGMWGLKQENHSQPPQKTALNFAHQSRPVNSSYIVLYPWASRNLKSSINSPNPQPSAPSSIITQRLEKHNKLHPETILTQKKTE